MHTAKCLALHASGTFTNTRATTNDIILLYSCTVRCAAVMSTMTASEPHPLPQHALVALLLLLLVIVDTTAAPVLYIVGQ